MEANVFTLHIPVIGFPLCEAVSTQIHSSCPACAGGAADWEAPLRIRWNKQSRNMQVGDFTPPDSSDVDNSCVVSERVRRVLERECPGLSFLPVIEVNKDHVQTRSNPSPLWWLKTPVLSCDPKQHGWKAIGRPCSECGRVWYDSPARVH